jgi:NADPH:quinone reductase-like Zn-dependent oxidoreductase
MQALVVKERGKVVVETVPIPQLETGEILVKVRDSWLS